MKPNLKLFHLSFVMMMLFSIVFQQVKAQKHMGIIQDKTLDQEFTIYVKRILILGDSHLVGNFGEMLHKGLHESGKFDILSIAIGGAGSRNFTMTMRNNCCGYIIRQSFYNELLKPEQKVRRMESNSNSSGEIVGKLYKGKLENVLLQFEPHIVVIALGHNNINDHQNLVNTIISQNKHTQIIWIAPLRNRNTRRQLNEIRKVTVDNNIYLVRSDDILGNDTAQSIHFSGKTAQHWAQTVIERMQPMLSENYSILKQIKKNLSLNGYDTIASSKTLSDVNIFSLLSFNQSVPSQIVTGLIFKNNVFSPKYLSRFFTDNRTWTTSQSADIEGNTYGTIVSGNSLWMSENLRSGHFADGSKIYTAVPGHHFYLDQHPELMYVYKDKKQTYIYYTWHAVNHPAGICPPGWHIPDIAECVSLISHLENPEQFFVDHNGWINSDGRRIESSKEGYFWTISSVLDNSNSAWVVGFDKTKKTFFIVNRQLNTGFPVRCIKD